jgi:cell wall-associated NlpC family hydrolase
MNRRGFVRQVVGALLLGLLVATTGCASPMKPLQTGGISRLGFSIQVGAFAEVKNAERLTNRLQAKGIEAFYFRKDSGVYVVRFGDYRNRDQARKGAEKLVAEKLIDSYFIASPDAVFKKSQRVTQPVEPPKTPPAVKRSGAGDMGSIAARTAERFVGIPYRWGGENVVDGMDCSGFVRAVYNLCGVNIPRTSGEQFKVGETVDREKLADGDLVFFGSSADKINHVGIYVGGGKFVHAPRRGDEIKVSTIDENYFASRFVGAKRYF